MVNAGSNMPAIYESVYKSKVYNVFFFLMSGVYTNDKHI